MTSVTAFPVDRSARATRRRLLNPAGGRVSTELEITTAPELRRARIKEALQQEAERRSSALSEAIAAARKRAEDARHQRELSTDLKSSLVPNIPTINAIITAVSDFYRINLVDMISQRRTADLVRARQTAMWIARFLTVRSTPQIGRAFGGRDHTTVLHALRKIDERLMNEPRLAAELRSICATLQVASPRALDEPENAEPGG